MVSSAPPRWLTARLASRTGSAHRRRAAPCQDACGAVVGCDRDGEAVQVLVVSDGHGGTRYHRSDAGSRLACAVALAEAARSLAVASTADPAAAGSGATGWADWLARQLPGRIVAAWRQSVLEHREAQPQAAATVEEENPWLAYGATLGLLVLTPRWWGHTGLGDWDLVRVGGSGAALLSEEPATEAGGEATHSLCMPRCERHFAPRSALHRLDPQVPPFQLLLCTDGIRKSCGSDADFLTLAGYLLALDAAEAPGEERELAAALDHISREGSGDDVSAVLARWGPEPELQPASAVATAMAQGLTDPLRLASPQRAGHFRQPLVLQPPPPGAAGLDQLSLAREPESSPRSPSQPSAGSAPPLQASTAAEGIAGPTVPPSSDALSTQLTERHLVGPIAAQPPELGSPGRSVAQPDPPIDVSRRLARRPAPRRSLPSWLPSVSPAALGLLALLAAGGGLLAWRLRLGPFAPPPEPPLLMRAQRQAIERLVGELCRRGAPERRPGAAREAPAGAPQPAAAAPGAPAAPLQRSPVQSAPPARVSGPAPLVPGQVAAAVDRTSRIRAALAQRRGLLQSLAGTSQEELRQRLRGDRISVNAPTLPSQGLARPGADPLSDLILLSRLRPSPLQLTVPQRGPSESATTVSGAFSEPLAPIRVCPELLGELKAPASPAATLGSGTADAPLGPETPNR